jgi:anti-sigma regulatory factor (Ser/Thr protein kinase)
MAVELLDLRYRQSMIAQILASHGNVDLTDYCDLPLSIPENYKTIDVRLTGEDIYELSHQINPLTTLLDQLTQDKRASAGLGEAVFNAYIHGNKRNPGKKVLVHYYKAEDSIDILVEDEGGVIDAELFSYILSQRNSRSLTRAPTFYEFTERKTPEGRGGTGTLMMHYGFNEVNYYMSKKGGLMVQLKLKLQNKDQIR